MRRIQKLKELNQKLIANKLLEEEINSLEAQKIKLEEHQNKSREKQLELEKKLRKMKAKNAGEKDFLEKELNSLRKEQQAAEDELDKAIAEFDGYMHNLLQECTSPPKKLRIELEKEILEGEVKQLIEAKERQRTELEEEISELKTKHSNEIETLEKHRKQELLRAEDERREVVDERNRLKKRLDKLQKEYTEFQVVKERKRKSVIGTTLHMVSRKDVEGGFSCNGNDTIIHCKLARLLLTINKSPFQTCTFPCIWSGRLIRNTGRHSLKDTLLTLKNSRENYSILSESN
uniref:Uncharacterized protein n=1 Tax=Glossina pallidipes TaxID=7398 RepID=A0A1B0A0T7_GLOPL